MVNKFELSPSILAGNYANLGASAKEVENASLSWIHIDIMDGHFVPNLSFGPQLIADLKKVCPNLFYDTHLMLDNPHLYIDAFAKAGANLICVHVEPDYPIQATLQDIHEKGCQVGISLNPKTDISQVYNYLPFVDLVLVMSVQPGFGGQKFQDIAYSKVKTLKKWRDELKLNFRIEVDGGVNADNVQELIKCGADTIVAGTAFFKNKSALLGKINEALS